MAGFGMRRACLSLVLWEFGVVEVLSRMVCARGLAGFLPYSTCEHEVCHPDSRHLGLQDMIIILHLLS